MAAIWRPNIVRPLGSLSGGYLPQSD